MTVPDDARWTQVAQHRDRLLRIARRRCPTPQDAEDVVADAMLTAATYDALDPDRLGPLLTALTVRFAANGARRRGVEQRALPRLHEPGTDDLDDILTIAETRWLDGLAASTLTAVERSVLLYRADGFSTAAAAGALAITERSAASALTRARRKLRAAWRATLGAFGLSHLRRAAPAGAAVAIAAVALVTSAMPRAPGLPPVVALPMADAPPVTHERPVRAAPPVPATRLGAPANALAAPETAERAAPQVRRPTVMLPPVDAPLLDSGSRRVTVTVDDREPVGERLTRCVQRGVAVQANRRTVGIICKP